MANVLQCPQCQAPLKWRGKAAVVECCFCKSHVITGQPGTAASGDKAGTLTMLPADAVTLKARSVATGFVASAALALLALGGAAFWFVNVQQDSLAESPHTATRSTVPSTSAPASRGSKAPSKASAPAHQKPGSKPSGTDIQTRTKELLAVSPSLSARAFARAVGATIRGSYLEATLLDSPFAKAIISWRKGAKHAHAIRLLTHRRHAPFEDRLAALLGPRFERHMDGSRAFVFGGTRVTLSADGRNLEGQVLDRNDPDWRERFQALWKALRAATGTSGASLSATERELLFRGYMLRDIISFDLELFTRNNLNGSKRPSGFVRLAPREFAFPIDNPWFKEASLIYPEGRTQTLDRIDVTAWKPKRTNAELAHHSACLLRALGLADTGDEPGRLSYTWKVPGLQQVTLTATRFSVSPDLTAPKLAQRMWRKVWRATAECSGESLGDAD